MFYFTELTDMRDENRLSLLKRLSEMSDMEQRNSPYLENYDFTSDQDDEDMAQKRLFYSKSNNEKCKDFCDSVFDEEPKLAASCFNECLTDKDFTKHLENLLY